MQQPDRIPAAGMPVFSSDGVHLGHVLEVDAHSGWFKINAPQAPDFWLKLQDVQECTARYALLSIKRSEVRASKWEGPEPERPTLSAVGTDRADPRA